MLTFPPSYHSVGCFRSGLLYLRFYNSNDTKISGNPPDLQVTPKLLMHNPIDNKITIDIRQLRIICLTGMTVCMIQLKNL